MAKKDNGSILRTTNDKREPEMTPTFQEFLVIFGLNPVVAEITMVVIHLTKMVSLFVLIVLLIIVSL